MNILVTGGSGYLGSRLMKDLAEVGRVTGTYHTVHVDGLIRLDVTNASSVREVVQPGKWDVIVHAAADPSPKSCEDKPELAQLVNGEAVALLADAAGDAHVYLISSSSAVHQLDTVYGVSKRLGEEKVKSAKFWNILRPSLIVGQSDNVMYPRQQNRFLGDLLGTHEPVYDDKWLMQPTYAGHISDVIKVMIEKKMTGLTLDIAVEEQVTRYGLAVAVFGHAELKDLEVVPRASHDGWEPQERYVPNLAQNGLPEMNLAMLVDKTAHDLRRQYEQVKNHN